MTDEFRYHEDQDPEDWDDLADPCYCDDCHQARVAWYGTDPVARLPGPGCPRAGRRAPPSLAPRTGHAEAR